MVAKKDVANVDTLHANEKNETVICFNYEKQGYIGRDHPNPKKELNNKDQMGSTSLDGEEERQEYGVVCSLLSVERGGEFLGHVISQRGIVVDPSKIEVAIEWEAQSQCLRLGLVTIYTHRGFIWDSHALIYVDSNASKMSLGDVLMLRNQVEESSLANMSPELTMALLVGQAMLLLSEKVRAKSELGLVEGAMGLAKQRDYWNSIWVHSLGELKTRWTNDISRAFVAQLIK
ncbi:hypothetical protein CR513_03300, partial [Mucuna pruriens]